MRTMQGWNRMQWQLDPYKWYLHNYPARYQTHQFNQDSFMLLPQTYDRKFSKIMRILSKEGTFGFLIFLVISFTFYMHTFLLDNSRSKRIPIFHTFNHHKYFVRENVMVAIIMHNPSRFLKTTLTSLNESKHEADIFIFRDYIGDHIYQEASQWYPSAKVISDKGRARSTDIFTFVMNKFISLNYGVLVYINSYSVLANDWWDTLKQGLAQSRGFFSLYGIERDEENFDKCNDLLCCQSWMGMVGSVWRRNLAARVLSETAKVEGNLNYKMEFWRRMFNIPLQSVRNSVMAVIDSDKRNYNLKTHEISIRQRQQHQVTAVKLMSGSLTNYSETLQNKKQPSENQFTSTTANKVQECIAAVLTVHVYRKDRTTLTAYEIEQWIRYMQHAGVNIVYFYDAYENKIEKLDMWVKQVFEPDEIIYHDWYFNRTFQIKESRQSALQHATDHYKNVCEWHIHTDINEYPLISSDIEKDFLKRLVKRVKSSKPNCTEISFPVFQFSGNQTQKQWLVERFQYRYSTHVHTKVKLLYLAKYIKTADLYRNKLNIKNTEYLDPKLARINRYLCTSMNKTVANTTETLGELIPDSAILPLLRHLKPVILMSNKMPLYATNQFWDFTK